MDNFQALAVGDKLRNIYHYRNTSFVLSGVVLLAGIGLFLSIKRNKELHFFLVNTNKQILSLNQKLDLMKIDKETRKFLFSEQRIKIQESRVRKSESKKS